MSDSNVIEMPDKHKIPEGFHVAGYQYLDTILWIVKREEGWAVSDGYNCLSKTGKWKHEKRPSERTPNWLKETRWNDISEAFIAAKIAYEESPDSFR